MHYQGDRTLTAGDYGHYLTVRRWRSRGVKRREWGELTERQRRQETQYHTDDEVGFKRLLLRFMAEDLLTGYRARPSADQPEYQQGRLRHPTPGLARRHFINAVNHQRQYAGQQEPRDIRVRSEQATGSRADQE